MFRNSPIKRYDHRFRIVNFHMVDNDQTNCVKQENSNKKRTRGGKQIDVKRHRGNTIHFGNIVAISFMKQLLSADWLCEKNKLA